MKKIYLMLISLLCLVFSAQAAVVTDLSQLSNDKVYTLRTKRAFLLYSSKCDGKLAASTGKRLVTPHAIQKTLTNNSKLSTIMANTIYIVLVKANTLWLTVSSFQRN